METEYNLLKQFENLTPIEPSVDWNEQLMQNLKHTSKISHKVPTYAWVMVVMVILLSLNLISFSKGFISQNSDQNVSNYKNVANEFFITTSSSKY